MIQESYEFIIYYIYGLSRHIHGFIGHISVDLQGIFFYTKKTFLHTETLENVECTKMGQAL